MTFLSLSYTLFLPLVVAAFWLAPTRLWRLTVLLIASLIFYGLHQPIDVPLLLAGVLSNFWLGLAIGGVPSLQVRDLLHPRRDGRRQQQRKKLLTIGVVFNILLLFGFKYIPFVLNTLGWGFQEPALFDMGGWVTRYVVAPLGLSFFAFECIAYQVDVFRGAPPAEDFIEFASYKLFFPKLLSGPIVRYQSLAGKLKNIAQQRFLNSAQLSEGLWLIACGAIKKGIVADSLAIAVNLSFNNIERAGSGDIWLATVAYGLQLYLDFSGYVDIARGSALLLGFELPMNFDFPYLSNSLGDFWRRWHMTLGAWLRNYLYFPLGGSRLGLGRTCVNLCIVMLLGGLWHGAARGYIVWGGIHGLGLACHRCAENLSQRSPLVQQFWRSPPGWLLGWGLTQATVFFSWIFFRLPDLNQSGRAIVHFFNHPADPQFVTLVYQESLGLDRSQMVWLLLGIMVIMTFNYAIEKGLRLKLNWPIKLVLAPTCLLMVWALAPEGAPFIYFNF